MVYAKIDENDEPTQIRHLLDIDELFEESHYEEDGGNDDGSGDTNNTTSELVTTKKTQPDESVASNFGSFVATPMIKTRSQTRRLSDIAEESGIQSPIVPLQIRQINV